MRFEAFISAQNRRISIWHRFLIRDKLALRPVTMSSQLVMPQIKSHKDLVVWQKAVALANNVYLAG